MARRSARKQRVETFDEEGVVKGISEKLVTAKGKKVPIYSFILQDNDEWFRTSFEEPDFEKGDLITFSYSVGDYGNDVDMKSIEILEEDAAAAEEEEEEEEKPTRSRRSSKSKTKPKAVNKSGNKTTKDDFWAAKEKRDVENGVRISYHGAVNTAVNIVSALIANEQIALPTLKKRKAAFDDLVAEYAEQLFAQTQDVEGLLELLEDAADGNRDE